MLCAAAAGCWLARARARARSISLAPLLRYRYSRDERVPQVLYTVHTRGTGERDQLDALLLQASDGRISLS
ncbi:hypothetical protein IE81DRAFT_107623 [Ceraceosorus guamensis]|uniref:Uncharacterized protein n=1 Tax=Ceraceosorus guamensis TaxID=1522189 RepID=A0A316VZR7_9BASI|nr:hypothetical protein IE81DRAFT_107623 [Ceraceosorus guamensis]PWN42972.1 hypothetical protein IE81DRAFT_107623 [Ceraceosorus guamensis]